MKFTGLKNRISQLCAMVSVIAHLGCTRFSSDTPLRLCRYEAEILERLICFPIPGKLLIAQIKPPRKTKMTPINIAVRSPLLSIIQVEIKHVGILKQTGKENLAGTL